MKRILILCACAWMVACVGPRKTVEEPVTEAPAGIQCPERVDDESWRGLSEACKGRLALAQASQSASEDDWAQSVKWAERASENLEESLVPQAALLLAEGRYALGQTEGIVASIEKHLAEADEASRGRLLYYIGEIKLTSGQPLGAVANLSESLAAATAGASWRAAAVSLLEAASLRALELPSERLAEAPSTLSPLRKLAEVDQALQSGNTAEARETLEALAESEQVARLGLSTPVQNRLEEVRLRGEGRSGRIGVVLPLSGRAGRFGSYVLRGILLGADVFNESDRVLLIEDDRGEPFRSVRAMRSLASRGAMAVIGPLLGRSAEIGAHTSNRMGLPTVVLSSANLPALAPWTVRNAVTPRQQIEALLDETIDKRGFQRFAVLHPTDAYGYGMRDIFWDAVVERGGQITGVQTYEPASTDFRSSIRELVGADEFTEEEVEEREEKKQPLAHLDFDALFIPDGAKTVGLILPQLLYFDVRGPVFMGPSTWNDPRLVKLGREYSEGALFVDWYWTESNQKATREFLRKYEQSFGGTEPPSVTAQGYDAGVLVGEVVAAENRTGARERLYDRNWQTFSGEAQVVSSGEVKKPLVMLTVVGRRIVPIEQSPAY